MILSVPLLEGLLLACKAGCVPIIMAISVVLGFPILQLKFVAGADFWKLFFV